MSVDEMEPPAELKLTDINQFCLEKVCGYLGFGDLLDVADTNKHLKVAARSAFAKKYGKKPILIDPAIKRDNKIKEEKLVEIRNWKRSYQLMRCFGDVISILKFRWIYVRSDERGVGYENLIAYVNEYCGEALSDIKIEFISSGGLNHFERPFPMVKNVYIGAGESSDGHLLKILFPNMNSMVYINVPPEDVFVGLNRNFPKLEHVDLRMALRQDAISTDADCASLYLFLQLNPQLGSLTMPFSPNKRFLEVINESLPNLQKLSFNDSHSCIPDYTGPSVHFKNVYKLEMHLMSARKPKFPFTFDQLDEFVLENYITDDDELYSFLESNPTIQKVTFITCCFLRGFNHSRFAQSLPHLKEADLSQLSYYKTADDVENFLDKCHQLQKFSFRISNNVNPDELIEKCNNNGWQSKKFSRIKHFEHEVYIEMTKTQL